MLLSLAVRSANKNSPIILSEGITVGFAGGSFVEILSQTAPKKLV